MDIVSKVIGEYVVGKSFDHIINCFKTSVIERWSRYRAEKFFNQFCLEIANESNITDPNILNDKIEKILTNENYSEVLFEAYRKVSLSLSKEIGPRIIAYVVAKMVSGKQWHDSIEEVIFSVAENLNDSELISFLEFFNENNEHAKSYIKIQKVGSQSAKELNATFDNYGNLKIHYNKAQFDSNSPNDNASIAPINFARDIGIWASKLKNFGVISEEIIEEHWTYNEDSERHIDQDGEVREINWWIIVEKDFFIIAELISRFKDIVKE